MQPKPTNLSTRPLKQRNTLSVEVSVFLHVHSWIFFKDNINEWVTFACDETGSADESKKDETRPGMVSSKLVGCYTYYCFLAYSF